MHSSKHGLILYTYNRVQQGREQIYAIGKLASGETFGIIDQHHEPHFYINPSDLPHAEEHFRSVRVQDSEMHNMQGQDLLKLCTDTDRQRRTLYSKLQDAGIATWEADLRFARSWSIDRGIRGSMEISGEWKNGSSVDWIVYNPEIANSTQDVQLTTLIIDIETDFNGVETGNEQVTAVSYVGAHGKYPLKKVCIVDPARECPETSALCTFPDERSLLVDFAKQIMSFDPDIISGWNVIDFDMHTLAQRFEKHKIPFVIGRSQDTGFYRKGKRWGSSKMDIAGRQVLDAMHLMRHTLRKFEDYKLDSVAEIVLGRHKLLHDQDGKTVLEQIQDAYRDDKIRFAAYCLEDSQLVLDILEAEDLIPLTVNRANLTGLPLDRAWGSVEAFEFLYLSELHKRRVAARTVNEEERDPDHAPGGYVFTPIVGLYDHIFVFDFKSLYPSIIRTLNIDPLAYEAAFNTDPETCIRTPNDALFVRERGILPELLDVFFDKRAEAKTSGNDLASYTYKIVMNSFYGVLGSSACRFAKPQLAGAITHFGHLLLKWCRDLLESHGYTVLYGDTDSVFVNPHVAKNISDNDAQILGDEICEMVNKKLADYISEHYQCESRLELEFEKHYHKLLLPPSRDDEEIGRAKGYAGLIKDSNGERIDVIGLEAVRRDWTDMAHVFQRHLFDLIFHETAPDEIESFIRQQVIELYAGKYDADLVYRRALRKPVSEYTKTTPPHVKAARLLPAPKGLIHYVMSIHGPQPVSMLHAAIDYDHYLSKQIEPIVHAVANICGIDSGRALKGEQRFL